MDQLPSILLLLILRDYLDDAHDLSSFDTAISQEKLRQHYLSIYQNTYIHLFENNVSNISRCFIHNSKTLTWIKNRSIQLNSIIVSRITNKTLFKIDQLPTLTRYVYNTTYSTTSFSSYRYHHYHCYYHYHHYHHTNYM